MNVSSGDVILSPGANVGSVLAEDADLDDLDVLDDLDELGVLDELGDLVVLDDLDGLDVLDDPLPEDEIIPKNASDSNGRDRNRDTARISIHSLLGLNDLHIGCLL